MLESGARVERPGDLLSAPPSVRPRPARLSALSVRHSELVLYGAFVRARRSLSGPKRRLSARAVVVLHGPGVAGKRVPSEKKKEQ